MNPIWKPEFTHQDVQIEEQKWLYKGFCSVKRYALKFRLFKGGWSSVFYRECVSRSAAVAIVLYDAVQDLVVLTEQVRVGAFDAVQSPWILEIVAGMVEEGETPECCAIREVKEEAGYDIQTLMPICTYWTSPGFTNEKMILYCGLVKAKSSAGVFGLPHDGEDIKVHVLKAEEAFLLLKAGKIISSPAVIGLQWLELNHASLLRS